VNKDDYRTDRQHLYETEYCGRTLTREEIRCMAESGWIPKETEGKSAGKMFGGAKATLGDRGFHLRWMRFSAHLIRLASKSERQSA